VNRRKRTHFGFCKNISDLCSLCDKSVRHDLPDDPGVCGKFKYRWIFIHLNTGIMITYGRGVLHKNKHRKNKTECMGGKIKMASYAEITEKGYLSIPKRSVEKMRLKAGMRFKLLADEDDILVLRLVHEEKTRTQVDMSSLLLQQQSLKNIWDSEEEDVYEL